MPYVSKNKPFRPTFINGIFAWYDNYNFIYGGGPSQTLPNYTFTDLANFGNNLVGTTNIKYFSNAPSGYLTFSNYDYAKNIGVLNLPTQPQSFTIFYVGKTGVPTSQNRIVSLFDSTPFSIPLQRVAVLVVDNYNFAYATNMSNTGNTYGQFAGSYQLLNNRLNTNIFTATFDGTNSELWVNGLTGCNRACTVNFLTGINNITNYVLTIQCNFGFTTNDDITRYNSFNEAIFYNRILTPNERVLIESYLANKWNTIYPGIPLTGITGIPGLIMWYNLIDSNSVKSAQENTNTNTNITSIFDSSGFSNLFYITNSGTGLTYSNGFIIPLNNNFFIGNSYSNYLLNIPQTQDGITVSFVVTNAFYKTTSIQNTSNIMSFFAPSIIKLTNYNYPCFKTDSLYSVFAGGNSYTTSNNGYPIFIGSNRNKDRVAITIQYLDNGQVNTFVNGYSMLINSNGPTKWANSNFFTYFAGITTSTSNLFLSPLDIGETLVYNRLLTQSELNTVHTHILSNYSINSNILSNGLIGWFDSSDFSASNGQVIHMWPSKAISETPLVLSNPTNYPALVRNYSNSIANKNLTFIDLNNGVYPSYFVNQLSVPVTYSNLLVFYVILGNSNLINSNSYNVSFGHSNGSVTYLATSNFTNIFGNTSQGIYASNVFSVKANNVPQIGSAYASNSSHLNTRFDSVAQQSVSIRTVAFFGSNISNINIGAYLGTNYAQTQIGEVLIYNRPLCNYEYTNVLSYLQSKWCSPTTVTFPDDYVLRYDACNINLGLTSWTPILGPTLFNTNSSVRFGYMNRVMLSNTTTAVFSNILNMNLSKGFTIFTVSGPQLQIAVTDQTTGNGFSQTKSDENVTTTSVSISGTTMTVTSRGDFVADRWVTDRWAVLSINPNGPPAPSYGVYSNGTPTREVQNVPFQYNYVDASTITMRIPAGLPAGSVTNLAVVSSFTSSPSMTFMVNNSYTLGQNITITQVSGTGQINSLLALVNKPIATVLTTEFTISGFVHMLLFNVLSFTVGRVLSNGDIISLLNASNAPSSNLGPIVNQAISGESNMFKMFNSSNINPINEINSYTKTTVQPLINCFRYETLTQSYSIQTKGTTLQSNNTNIYTYSNPQFSNILFSIGNSTGTRGFPGLIGEVIVYNRPLNDYEIEKMSASLIQKWKSPIFYPVTFPTQSITSNQRFMASNLNCNIFVFSNVQLASNAYNIPMTYSIISDPSVEPPTIFGTNLLQITFNNIYGSCNYLMYISTSNAFDPVRVTSNILFSGRTNPGAPIFPVSFSALRISCNIDINTTSNDVLIYSNIFIPNILCNDAFSYDRFNTLIYSLSLRSNGTLLPTSAYKYSIQNPGPSYSNLTVTLSNLYEDNPYIVTLSASNVSGSNSFTFATINILPAPSFQNTTQRVGLVSCNYNFLRFNTLQGAAKAPTSANYYVVLSASSNSSGSPSTTPIFTTILSLTTSATPYSNVILTLSNLVGMTFYRTTLVACNASRINASNQFSNLTTIYYQTPPGPPAFFTNWINNLTITCNSSPNSITFSNFVGPYLQSNAKLYPSGGWGAWNPVTAASNSGLFAFYTILSNTLNNIGSAVPAIGITCNLSGTTTAIPPGLNIASNLFLRLSGVRSNVWYFVTFGASNNARSTSNVFPSVLFK